MSGTNVVPMPNMWSGSMPAGCCPPSGMSSLMQCYCDIQAATAFISKVVTDLAANDPAFQKALVDGIVASGSNIPLIGVTNGNPAQAGQVGEYFEVSAGFQFPAATNVVTQTLTVGVLQPGDWDVWAWAEVTTTYQTASFFMTPLPAGFAHQVEGALATAGAEGGFVMSTTVQALISVPSLVNFSATISTLAASGAGSFTLYFAARRRR